MCDILAPPSEFPQEIGGRATGLAALHNMDQYQKFASAMSELQNAVPDMSSAHFIVALSGGADSSLLLRYALEYLKTPSRLTAAHVNHMIRGDEATRDERFCTELTSSLGIAIRIAHIDIPKMAAESGRSIEEAAREARYKYLEELATELAEKHGKIYVMTAHNADDNIETLLINITRGSGLRGLCAIPPIRGIFIRPMLKLTSDEIREYMRESSLPYVVDSTNLSNDYTRNKLRHSVIPILREINPSLCKASVGMFESLRSDSDYLSECMENALGEYYNKTHCPISVLQKLPSPLRSRAMMKLYQNVIAQASLERGHIEAIRALVLKGAESSRLDLPRNVECYINKGSLCFRKKEGAPLDLPRDISLPREIATADFTLTALEGCLYNREILSLENIYKLSIHTTLCSDKIIGRIIVRTRRDGDTIRFGNMTRKVKKLLSEKHIPLHIRDRLPIIEDEAGILWIPGFPPRDGTSFKGSGNAVTFIFRQISTESQDII